MKARVCVILLLVSSLMLCSCNNDKDKGGGNPIPVNPSSGEIELGMTYEEVMDKLSKIEDVTEADNNIYCYGVDGYKIVGYVFNSKSLESIVITAEAKRISPEQLASKLLKGYNLIGTVSSVDTYVDEKNNMIAVVSTSTIDDAEYSSVAFCRYDGGGNKEEEVEEYSGEQNGHKYIDLGLSVKWATCNVGADKPEEYGEYYSWGNTKTGNNTWETYKWANGDYDLITKYCLYPEFGKVDNKSVLDLNDDVAYVKWGNKWRMPTKQEIDELRKNCTINWYSRNGVYGIKMESNKNGKSIFFPAAGYFSGESVRKVGELGEYWSNTLYESGDYLAYDFYFKSSTCTCTFDDRIFGMTIRPVCK